MAIVVWKNPCIIVSVKTKTVWMKFANCFEMPLAISNTQKMQKIEKQVYHLKVNIYKSCRGSIQCWKHLMPTLMNDRINSFMCYGCL